MEFKSFIPIIISISGLIYTLALFSNNWFYSKDDRFGFYQTCKKTGCAYDDPYGNALTLEIIGYVLFVIAILLSFLSFLIPVDETVKNKLKTPAIIYTVFSTLFVIAGWARFSDAVADQASVQTKAGYSFYLVLVAWIIAALVMIIELVFVLLNNTMTVNAVKGCTIGLLVSFLFYNVGLFTDSWIVSTDVVLPLKFKRALFFSCLMDKCTEDTSNVALTFELFGFVFVLHAALLSIFLTIQDKNLGLKLKSFMWIFTLISDVLALIFIITGWARYKTFIDKEYKSTYKEDWSFYLVIPSFIGIFLAALLILLFRIRQE